MTKEEIQIAQAACCVGTMWNEYEGTEDFDRMVGKRVQHLIALVQKLHPSLPSNLNEAAKEASQSAYSEPTAEGFAKRCFFKRGFKAGAVWTAGQGYVDTHAVINEYKDWGDGFAKLELGILNNDDFFEDWQEQNEIIVQIRKKQ